MPVFVGCDLGTMGTKAAVVTDDGTIIGEAFEEVALHTPRPGVVEQDLAEIESSAHRTIAGALEDAGTRDVAAVSFSSQMSGIGTIDESFSPATHYDSWLDTRCEPYIERMAEHATRVIELSGCPPTYSHGPKILWWQHERPADFARIARFVVPSAYVSARLAGLPIEQAYVDRTYLHFSNLADNGSGTWAEELIEAFDVEHAKLPRIVDTLDVIGEVTVAGERETGLPVGIPIAAGAGDTTATALGAALVDPGDALDVAGTASVFAVCLDRFAPDVEHQTIMASRHVIPDRWVGLAFINGGGLALRWFRDEVATEYAHRPDAYAELDALAEEVEPGCGGLLWFPHVQGRVLPPRPKARGAWIGVTAGQRHAHLYRAILEGIAFEYDFWADAISAAAGGIDLTEARAVGGGASSRLWNQIKADVLGISWVPLERQEAGALGNALVAAAATGYIDDLAEAAVAWQEMRAPVVADDGRHGIYRRFVHAYRELTEHLPPVLDALGDAVP